MKKDNSEQTLIQYCYKQLKESIIRGDFAPGEKLKIAKLKVVLGVGPTPIREALSRLIASGLIESEENKGFRVKEIKEEEVRDLYSTFIQIENLCLSQAMDLGDSSWEAKIIAALYELGLIEKKKGSVLYEEWCKKNDEFHLALIEGCKSPCLLKIRESLHQLFERYCYLSFLNNQKPLSLNHKDHTDLAKAVIGRDKEKAYKLMTLHLENSFKQVVQKFRKNKIL